MLLTLLENVLGIVYLLLLFIVLDICPGIKISQALRDVSIVFLLKDVLETLEDPLAVFKEYATVDVGELILGGFTIFLLSRYRILELFSRWLYLIDHLIVQRLISILI